MPDEDGFFARLRKGVKRKKAETKAARNKRQRQRAKRRQALAERREAAEDFAGDVSELAGATRPAGAVRRAVGIGESAVDAGARGVDAAGRGLDAVDEGLGQFEEPALFGPGERNFLDPEDIQKAEERAEREVRDSLIKQRKADEKEQLRDRIEAMEEDVAVGPDLGMRMFGDGDDDDGDGRDEFRLGPPEDLV